MEEDEHETRIRRGMKEIFGSFENFNERINREGVKNGVARARIPTKSEMPVHLIIRSMTSLVDDQIGPLPSTFLKKNQSTPDDRRKRKEEASLHEERPKRSKIEKKHEPALSPDSGVHSTENDIGDENQSVEEMLSIMKSLDEPPLSPIPTDFLLRIKRLEEDKKKRKEKEEEEEEEVPSTSSSSPSYPSLTNGQLSLKNIKSEKLKKLMKLARQNGCLVEEKESTNSVFSNAISSTKVSAEPTRSFKCAWTRVRLSSPIKPEHPEPGCANRADFYQKMAKKYKSQADVNRDRVYKLLDYMISSVYFILQALAKLDADKAGSSKQFCVSMCRETAELLRSAANQAMRPSEDVFVMHMLPRLKMLAQTILAIMNYQIYVFRSDVAVKTMMKMETNEVLSKVQKVSAENTPNKLSPKGSDPMVTMPMNIYSMMSAQLKMINPLIIGQKYWEDCKTLSMQIDAEFIKGMEQVCGRAMPLDSSFDQLSVFVLTTVASLKLEYEEEKKLNVKPSLSKSKSAMDFAIKCGQFYTDKQPRNQPSK